MLLNNLAAKIKAISVILLPDIQMCFFLVLPVPLEHTRVLGWEKHIWISISIKIVAKFLSMLLYECVHFTNNDLLLFNKHLFEFYCVLFQDSNIFQVFPFFSFEGNSALMMQKIMYSSWFREDFLKWDKSKSKSSLEMEISPFEVFCK